MKTIDVTDPSTGEVIERLPADDAGAVRAKYERARQAQLAWAVAPLEHKLGTVRAFREKIETGREELARILSREMGKPITQSRNELKSFLERIDFFTANVEAALRPETVWEDQAGNLTERISHEPLGVVANVSAWNYPYFVGGNVFVPALFTGNAVLYKPSEYASLTGLAIARVWAESGLPANVFTAVIGAGETGAALVALPVDGVFFTGSNATGTRIAQEAARGLKKVQLELGGKDPAYVCEDVDVKAAAGSLADGAFYNTGQSCCSVERIYVQDRILPQFLEAFLAEVRAFKIGAPLEESTYIGPLARAGQIKVLEEQVRDAAAKGARILLGGGKIERPGNYFAPTVLDRVDHSMAVMREESFGPIIGIMGVKDDDEAVRWMNDTAYGLTAGVYTPDRDRAERVLGRVQSGSAYWNCCDRVSPRLPWTAVKGSGIGLTLSREGIATFTRPRAWHLRKS